MSDITTKPIIHSVASTRPHKGGEQVVIVNIWAANGGPSITLQLTEAEARALARDLTDAADRLPRVGTAADLGCEVL